MANDDDDDDDDDDQTVSVSFVLVVPHVGGRIGCNIERSHSSRSLHSFVSMNVVGLGEGGGGDDDVMVEVSLVVFVGVVVEPSSLLLVGT